MHLEQYMADRRRVVEVALDSLLPKTTEPPQTLHEAMRYSVLAPGKRLRPILALAAAEAVGGNMESVVPAACALECVHAFSLIHDDLPCMDNDDMRRGRPTSHVVYGEAMALLAGDALLALAFELLASSPSAAPERVVEATLLLARASGTQGMVGGQVADMASQGKDVDLSSLQHIHSRKTGALLTASVSIGALLAGASSQELKSLEEYGRHVGLAFQIADDILDVIGDPSRIGKPVGSDARQCKATYPRLLGIEESQKLARQECEQALAAISSFGTEAHWLRELARFAVERDR